MRLLVLTILLALTLATPAAAKRQETLEEMQNTANPQVNFCMKTEDCVAVHPPCQAPLVVNRKFHDQMESNYDFLRTKARCADWVQIPEIKSMACVKNRCTAEMAMAAPDESPQAKDPQYCDTDAECKVVLGECCAKHFVNSKSAPALQQRFDQKRPYETCFFPDRRHVKNLRCEKHKCAAELEPPLELGDDDHSLKDKCEQ